VYSAATRITEPTEVSSSAKPPLKADIMVSSCCFSIMSGVVVNIRQAVSRCVESVDWLALNSDTSSSGHATSSSVCCRASSATASPTLLLTDVSCSVARHSSNFARMAFRSASGRVKKRSCVSPERDFRGFED
jgi:hypothetical protein